MGGKSEGMRFAVSTKSRGSQMGLLGASPRNRRSWRQSENETREEKVSGLVEEVVKQRKRRSKKEKLDLVLSLPFPSSSSIDDEYRGSLDRIRQLMADLIMWRDVARSSLWFGLGSLFFLSSCFAKGINFRISQIGLLFLGSSVLSSGSRVWTSYNILEALYAWLIYFCTATPSLNSTWSSFSSADTFVVASDLF